MHQKQRMRDAVSTCRLTDMPHAYEAFRRRSTDGPSIHNIHGPVTITMLREGELSFSTDARMMPVHIMSIRPVYVYLSNVNRNCVLFTLSAISNGRLPVGVRCSNSI